nr:MAG TPA: hypothetical protein [Caudoviricetes sp.]
MVKPLIRVRDIPVPLTPANRYSRGIFGVVLWQHN